MAQSLRSLDSDDLIIGKFENHETVKMLQTDAAILDDHLQKEDRRVLILHTGGTIGMFKSEDGYKPEKDRFTDFLKNYPYFCDKQETYFNSTDDFIITPKTVYGRRIWYKLKEMKTLIDSSNMSVPHWNDILAELKEVYHRKALSDRRVRRLRGAARHGHHGLHGQHALLRDREPAEDHRADRRPE